MKGRGGENVSCFIIGGKSLLVELLFSPLFTSHVCNSMNRTSKCKNVMVWHWLNFKYWFVSSVGSCWFHADGKYGLV